MKKHETISASLSKRMEQEAAAGTYIRTGTDNTAAIRRDISRTDKDTIWRPAFARDIDKILYCPYYNRYSDKTQVYSLVKNDDITRRSLHVQLVSRVARTIGSALHLNLDLIEAIALGHDMGHTPFGHAGEHYLDELFFQNAGRHFHHNIHSVRVLDGIFPLNLSLQVLDGIAGHNGEIELGQYEPVPLSGFAEFDEKIEKCYQNDVFARKMQPSTLEGAVVRISDIIAYLGKDRQDAARLKMVEADAYHATEIGSVNAEIINNLVVNIIENSYGKPYIKLDKAHFDALRTVKRDNYKFIYESAATRTRLDLTAKPMMAEIYGQLLEDLRLGKKNSPVFTHHIDYVNQQYKRSTPYEIAEPNQLVVDYIASMTDDYFIDLHHYLFPDSSYKVEYAGYFDEEKEVNANV